MLGRDPTDQRFAHYCRTGDPDALADVFDRTAGRLMRVALWLVGNRADAEDLLQRTFLRAIEARASFELGRPVLPWLLGLLGNQARQLRGERQRSAVVPARADQVVDAVAEAATRELEHAVVAVRDQLGAPYSEVLRLHLEEGLNGKEIAARLARSPGTVRTQMVRALEQLRRHLPGGFVAGLAALAVVDSAAIAAVRVGVLTMARAVPAPVPAAGSTITTATIGGLLMAKKFLLAVPLVLLLLGGVVWNALRESPVEIPQVPDAMVVSADVGDRVQEPKQPPALVADAAVERAPSQIPATSGEVGFAALRVLVRRAQDKVPVAGTWVHAQAGGSHLGYHEALTDDAGIARLDHLVPGSYFVATSLVEAYEQVSLTEGELRTLELVAKETSFVAGRVVDADGRPVAGARLWLSARGNWSLGGEVGRSAADGSFQVGLFAFHCLGAQADGHVPSLMQQFEAAQGRSFENVVLKLRGPAAGLQGLVVDIRGKPVWGATVLVGPPGGGVTNSGNRNFIQPNPERRLTGRDGRFVATGLPVGDVPLHVWAAGFGPHRQQLLPSAGRTESITITLVDGAVVTGVVRDAAGKPVAKVTVRFGDEFFSFPSCVTTTDEAGRFRLENLPAAPDSVSLVAFNTSSSAAASLSLAAGATTEWNPVLGIGKTIRGIVLGPGEVPLPGAKVGVVHPNFQRVQRWFDTSADGSFELQQVGDKPCSVQVALGERVLREARSVAPETVDLRIRIDALDLPTARLRGRIVDLDGKALEGSVALLRDSVRTSDSVQLDPGTGAFVFGPISAGRYRVLAYTKATGQLPLGAVDLRPDEERVLADVVVQPGGELEFHATDVAGEPVDATLVRLYTASGESISGGVIEHGRGKLGGVQPGRYLVEIQPDGKRGPNGVAQVLRASTEVQSGKTSQVVIHGRLCIGAQITFRDLGPANPERRVRVLCRDEQGHLHAVLQTFPEGRKPLEVQAAFAPGRYQLECQVDDGRVVAAELVVPSLREVVQVTLDLPVR
jgi:RNA polymerase sigma-70 factor (ECF subfamily)